MLNQMLAASVLVSTVTAAPRLLDFFSDEGQAKMDAADAEASRRHTAEGWVQGALPIPNDANEAPAGIFKVVDPSKRAICFVLFAGPKEKREARSVSCMPY